MNHSALLAIDTSTEFCSVAICFSLPPLADANQPALAESTSALSASIQIMDDPAQGLRFIFAEDKTGAVSSTCLLPMIDAVLQAATRTLNDCTAVAFGAGPGSFTGLRTATGIAQGLAFGADLPVIPVNTLMACAESARLRDTLAGCTRVFAAVDARMAECYFQTFDWSPSRLDWESATSPSVGAPIAAVPCDALTPYALVGNAASVFGEALVARTNARTIDADARPTALAVASIGWRAWQAGRAVPAADALPEYVRDKVALTTREREVARELKLTQQASATVTAKGA